MPGSFPKLYKVELRASLLFLHLLPIYLLFTSLLLFYHSLSTAISPPLRLSIYTEATEISTLSVLLTLTAATCCRTPQDRDERGNQAGTGRHTTRQARWIHDQSPPSAQQHSSRQGHSRHRIEATGQMADSLQDPLSSYSMGFQSLLRGHGNLYALRSIFACPDPAGTLDTASIPT
jgi:hypothetical protein